MSVNASPTAQSLVMAKKYEGRAGLIASVSDWMERLDCTTLYSSAEARLLESGLEEITPLGNHSCLTGIYCQSSRKCSDSPLQPLLSYSGSL